MKLTYDEKVPEEQVIDQATSSANFVESLNEKSRNLLIQGDNLIAMGNLLKSGYSEKIDLVYIDPPFATSTIFRHSPERTSTVSFTKSSDVAYEDVMRSAEYLEFIRQRLILIRELMAENASIYLHIDYKIGHYVKIIMDEVFGKENFRNDITRIKCNPKNFARKGYGNIKDMILFYSKTKNFTWNEPREPLSEEDIERLFPKVTADGRHYTTTPLHAPGETQNGATGKAWKGMSPPAGRHWRYNPDELTRLDEQGLIEWSTNGNPRKKIYADDVKEKGKRVQDVWEFKDKPYPSYPTEKNSELLKRIIQTSSNEGNLIIDSFCGSGTTLCTAQNLNRRWIGIDSSKTAIEVSKQKLKPASQKELFTKDTEYKYFEVKAEAAKTKI